MARGRGINKVIIIGNCGNDPDTRYTGQGNAVTNVSIATDESYKDKNTGQMVPKTEWHRVVMFNRLAEIAKEYLRKGAKVYIEGKLRTRQWQDQSGQNRYTTEIVANDMQMLDGNPNAAPQGGYQSPQQAPRQNNQPQQRPQYAGSQPPMQQGEPPIDDDDIDDIPFS